MAGKPDPEYVKARRILLDALVALSSHSDALVLVGAQAIYLHVGGGELAVAPYTTDGDLVIHPEKLPDSPLLEDALGRGWDRMATGWPGRRKGSRERSSTAAQWRLAISRTMSGDSRSESQALLHSS